MGEDHSFGLSSRNREYIVLLVFVALLLFGPVEPYGLVIRLAYLAVIPSILWFGLWYWGGRLDIDALTNERINRAITGSIAGVLLVGAYLTYTAGHHQECTQYARTSDGRECVGDYVTVAGGDPGMALMLLLFAGIAFWIAISRESD
jgi:hypothetical protein